MSDLAPPLPLLADQAWLTTLGAALGEGLIALDAAGRVIYLNSAAERFAAAPGPEAAGLALEDLLCLPGGERFGLDRLPAAGASTPVTLLDRAGRPCPVTVHVAALPAGDGTAAPLLIVRRVTEEEATRDLRAHFLANITHEFRTPLAALNAAVEFLVDELDQLSPAEVAELLTSIHLSATGLQTLIENLLESITIEAGRFTIRPALVDLDEVVGEAVQIVRPLLMRRHQQVNVAGAAGLPPVRADATRLTQVLVNLLSNASKFGPLDQTIEIRLAEEAGHIRVTVADRGPGIPRRQRSRLFQRFTRLGAPDGAQYGIGLGLYVVKSIVEGHGGAVGMEERPGGGSEFWFTLPLAPSRG